MEKAEIKYTLFCYALLLVKYPEKKEEIKRVKKMIEKLKEEKLIKEEDIKEAIDFLINLENK